MPSVYDLKPAFQRQLWPLCHGLAARGVTPNAVTVAALLLSLVGGLLLAWAGDAAWVLGLYPLILFVRMALNALDGMLARAGGLSTPRGEILNECGDVLSDLLLYAPWARWLAAEGLAWLAAFLVLSVFNEFCGILAKIVIGQRRYDGPMGKSDRAFLLGLSALILMVWPGFQAQLPWLFVGMTLLLVLSSLNRLRAAWQGAGS